MRKAILLILLAVVSRSAAAEWVKVGDEGIVTSYADPATIRRAGNMATMWDMLDFKAVQARPYGTPYMSQKTQQEYDCKEERVRIIHSLRYSDNMARGEEVYADSDPAEWKPVSPGSTIERLLKFACEKR
jgi:hypothetical protein